MRTSMKASIGVVAAIAMIAPAAQAAKSDGAPSASQQAALEQGLQVAPKAKAGAGAKALGPNPWVSLLPDQTKADYAGWQAEMQRRADKRMASSKVKSLRSEAFGVAPNAALPAAVVHDEEEPAGTLGSNDTHGNAERINGFGSAKSRNARVRVLGELAESAAPTAVSFEMGEEDNGSIPLATDSGISGTGAATTSSVLGDGPHGSDGTGTNDFDVVSLDVPAGQTVIADTEGSTGLSDSLLALYDAEGNVVASDDDGGTGLLSLLIYTADEAGTYYLVVAGYSSAGSLPADPFDSASGAGGGSEGEYELNILSQQVDTDYYSVRLRPGDVIGSVGEQAATGLTVRTPSGEERIGGVETDASSYYPSTSPLPGGGNTTIAYVAEEAGWYSLQVTGLTGNYDVTLEAFRPGTRVTRGGPRPCSWTLTRVGSTPARGEDLASVRCRRCAPSLPSGASIARMRVDWRTGRCGSLSATSTTRSSGPGSTRTSTSRCSTLGPIRS